MENTPLMSDRKRKADDLSKPEQQAKKTPFEDTAKIEESVESFSEYSPLDASLSLPPAISTTLPTSSTTTPANSLATSLATTPTATAATPTISNSSNSTTAPTAPTSIATNNPSSITNTTASPTSTTPETTAATTITTTTTTNNNNNNNNNNSSSSSSNNSNSNNTSTTTQTSASTSTLLTTTEITKEAQDKDTDSNTESGGSETNVPFKRLIVLNVEATCDENPTNPAAIQVTKENSEIIEFSFVVLDASTMQVTHKQQFYVKPERTPLTSFCTDVTGITWDKLESAGSLKDAIQALDHYIKTEIQAKSLSFCFVTHGGWVLRIQIPREARDKSVDLPNYIAFCRMFDLKQEIQRWQVHHPDINLRTTSLKDLCDAFQLTHVNNETVGLNACLTMVNVIRYFTSFQHSDVFVHPIDTNADLQQFKKEESKVIHLAGLPFEVTQGELEAWFSSNGLRPTTMWMIQPTDHAKPSISGFVLFYGHEDAMRALALNGRCLGDRPIEVCPSSERVIEAAGNMLVPFPLQAKSRLLRPGDWNCANCNFHNFASRRNCFKCNAENPNPSTTPTAHTTSFNPGDWICPNPSCSFHNYASRVQCHRCQSFRPNPTSQSSPVNSAYGSGGRHQQITFRPGDWYCPNTSCGFQNFASRATCFRCHTPNPTPFNNYTQPSYGYTPEPNNYGNGGGTFRAGDWYCPSCNAHNFASRFQCLKCSANKPYAPQSTPGYAPSGGIKRKA